MNERLFLSLIQQNNRQAFLERDKNSRQPRQLISIMFFFIFSVYLFLVCFVFLIVCLTCLIFESIDCQVNY